MPKRQHRPRIVLNADALASAMMEKRKGAAVGKELEQAKDLYSSMFHEKPPDYPELLISLTRFELQRFATALFLHLLNQDDPQGRLRIGLAKIASATTKEPFGKILQQFFGFRRVRLVDSRADEQPSGNLFDWLTASVDRVGPSGADWAWLYLQYRFMVRDSMPRVEGEVDADLKWWWDQADVITRTPLPRPTEAAATEAKPSAGLEAKASAAPEPATARSSVKATSSEAGDGDVAGGPGGASGGAAEGKSGGGGVEESKADPGDTAPAGPGGSDAPKTLVGGSVASGSDAGTVTAATLAAQVLDAERPVRWVTDLQFDEAHFALSRVRFPRHGFNVFVDFLSSGALPLSEQELDLDLAHWLYYDLVDKVKGSIADASQLPLLSPAEKPSEFKRRTPLGPMIEKKPPSTLDEPCLGASLPSITCLIMPVLWDYLMDLRDQQKRETRGFEIDHKFEKEYIDKFQESVNYHQWMLAWRSVIEKPTEEFSPLRVTLRFACFQRFRDADSLMRKLVECSRGVSILRAMNGEISTYHVIRVLLDRVLGITKEYRAAGTHGSDFRVEEFSSLQKDHPVAAVLLGTLPLFQPWLRSATGDKEETVEVKSVGISEWGAALLEWDSNRGLVLLARLLFATKEFAHLDPPPLPALADEESSSEDDDDEFEVNVPARGAEESTLSWLWNSCTCVDR